jgi:hypothetical protein
LTEAAKEAKRRYQREWYRKNREKARAYSRAYWERKGAEMKETDIIGNGDVSAVKSTATSNIGASA